MDNIVIKDGFEKMDLVKVTEMLSKAYWSPGIQIDVVKKGAFNSALVVGAFTEDNIQVGYARVVSDKTKFAYILDVIIDENYRRKGIGQDIMKYILSHEDLKDVYQWLLRTMYAHGVYSKLGFKPVSRPLDWMELNNLHSKIKL